MWYSYSYRDYMWHNDSRRDYVSRISLYIFISHIVPPIVTIWHIVTPWVTMYLVGCFDNPISSQFCFDRPSVPQGLSQFVFWSLTQFIEATSSYLSPVVEWGQCSWNCDVQFPLVRMVYNSLIQMAFIR